MSFTFQFSRFTCRSESLETRVLSLESEVRGPEPYKKRRSKILLTLGLLLFTFVSLSVFSACGRKTPVRPPELVAPEPIGDLTLEVADKGVRLQWGRPQKYIDGSNILLWPTP